MSEQALHLVTITPSPEARIRLVCFPYAAGSAAIYRFLDRVLPQAIKTQIDIRAVEYPGHGTRDAEDPLQSFSALTELLTDEIQSLFAHDQDDYDLILFGYSLGGLLAFEVARLLQIRGQQEVKLLLLASCNAPHAPLPISSANVAELAIYLQTLGMEPDTKEIERRWSWFQRVFTVASTYKPASEQALNSPFVVFGGLKDPSLTQDDLSTWQRYTNNSCSCHWIDGAHIFLRQPDFLRLLTQQLTTYIRNKK